MLDRFTAPAAVGSLDLGPVVLMVSRLVREKGCLDFLGLARALHGQADFVHVGPVEDDQRDAISSAEIAAASDDVSFVGAVDDIRPYLAAADVVVLPSYREGVPRVAMEAAAAGRPVVAYDVRGVREVVDPASGLLVPRGDTAALAARRGRAPRRPPSAASPWGGRARPVCWSGSPRTRSSPGCASVYAELARARREQPACA